jgi:uncharacterized lipoprotein
MTCDSDKTLVLFASLIVLLSACGSDPLMADFDEIMADEALDELHYECF